MGKILIAVFGGLIVALLLAVIFMIASLKKKDSSAELSNEFSKNREEAARGAKETREELSKGLEKVDEKLSLMTKENYDSRLDISEKLSQALSDIQKNSFLQSEKQSRLLQENMEKMQASNEKKLEEMRATVDEKLSATLTTRLNTSFKTVSEQLENVYKSLGEMKELSKGVTQNVTSLNRVLTNVKARGTWAEVQLESILDQTIPGMYEKNFSPKNNGERVEFAVKIPSGEKKDTIIYLPIDSKFPMEDYVRLCDAAESADPALLSAARKALEDRIKAEAKDVSKYICVPLTTPFAILYLATEGLYAEIASSKSGIAESLQAQNIMIAGPSTITALLNSFAMGFKAIAINEKADEVRAILGAAKAQYDKFGDVLEKARKKIEEAGRSLEDAQKRNTQIQKKLKGVEAFDSEEAASLLGLADTSFDE